MQVGLLHADLIVPEARVALGHRARRYALTPAKDPHFIYFIYLFTSFSFIMTAGECETHLAHDVQHVCVGVVEGEQDPRPAVQVLLQQRHREVVLRQNEYTSMQTHTLS